MKNSFVLYTDYRKQIEMLTDEQAGALLKALMVYASEQTVPDMDPVTSMAFSFIQAQIDRDNEKYNATCQKRKEAGRAGGRPKTKTANAEEKEPDEAKEANVNDEKHDEAKEANANLEKQSKAKKANGFFAKQNKAKKPDNDNDNEDDYEDDIKESQREKRPVAKASVPGGTDYSSEFRDFWDAYPRKDDKAMAYDKYCARLKDGYTPEELLQAAKGYAEECRKDRREKKYIKQGKTFLGPATPFTDYLPKGEGTAGRQSPPEQGGWTEEEIDQYRKFLEDTGQWR